MDELGILAVQQRRPDAISGGQQQRVALARALIRAEWQNRQLLLFDEPFSALDPDTRADCIDRVRHLVASKNMAALMVSHNPDDAIALNAAEISLPLSPA
jgi:thiamine transport system ATP-binding protein